MAVCRTLLLAPIGQYSDSVVPSSASLGDQARSLGRPGMATPPAITHKQRPTAASSSPRARAFRACLGVHEFGAKQSDLVAKFPDYLCPHRRFASEPLSS